mgnify:CR=1 FL=1
MIDFCVLGSGVAGSTIANLLSKKYSVHVFDKARGSGGRSSNKKFKKNFLSHLFYLSLCYNLATMTTNNNNRNFNNPNLLG